MKQLSSRILATVLSCALIASAIVGALSASVLPAKAEIPLQDGYLDDLLAHAREDCPSASLSQFDSIAEQLHDHFSDWLIVVMQKDDNWYFASYEYNKSLTFQAWMYIIDGYSGVWNRFVPRYSSDVSNMTYYSRYGFKILSGVFTAEPYNATLNYNSNFSQDPFFTATGWAYWAPDRSDLNESTRLCYSNSDLYYWDDSTVGLVKYMDSNLNNGSYVPPVIDFHWFKFQLGQRWYVTTYDQSLVANLETGDDTFWVWIFDKYLYSQEEPVTVILTWSDMQYLPAAAQFIEQNVTNVSVNGILAYDITDLVLSGDVIQFALSEFYQVLDTPSGMILGNVMADSEDIISLVLSPEEENESQNNAWNEISDYTENYPSVTISPQELAEQVLGSRAYTGSMGVIQMPSGIYDWCVQNKPNDIVHGDFSADGYWHYKLDSSGILSTNLTMINWELCNACIIPAPDPSWLSDYIGIDSYSFPVYWWNSSDQTISDASYLGQFTVDMILQQFDIVIFAPSDAPYLSNFDGIFQFTGSIGFTNLELDSQIGAVNGATRHQVFICSTDKVLLKSQLFAFCDSSNKMYDLFSQYIEKRDKWDDSFFKWSMSVFWELETLNGHLQAIRNEVIGWHLTDKFNDLISRADQIIQNTAPVDEEDVDPWYLSLWNFILQFKPSNSQISTGIDYIDQNLDDIPLLPYLTPVPALPTLGGG